jgi:hypothetical protein
MAVLREERTNCSWRAEAVLGLSEESNRVFTSPGIGAFANTMSDSLLLHPILLGNKFHQALGPHRNKPIEETTS